MKSVGNSRSIKHDLNPKQTVKQNGPSVVVKGKPLIRKVYNVKQELDKIKNNNSHSESHDTYSVSPCEYCKDNHCSSEHSEFSYSKPYPPHKDNSSSSSSSSCSDNSCKPCPQDLKVLKETMEQQVHKVLQVYVNV